MLNFAITHRARARLALSEDNPQAALRWARSAVANASRIDSLEVRADAALDLARVLEAVGQRGRAVREARAALALFTEKGHRPGIGNARALLANSRRPTNRDSPDPGRTGTPIALTRAKRLVPP
jgi:hypothetical protein